MKVKQRKLSERKETAMKIKSIKKLLVFLMTAVMVLGMSIAVSAATGSTEGVTTVNGDTELSIKKTVRMENAEAGTYNQPDITYTYKVEPATPPTGATVTGSGTNAGTILVDEGPENGVLIVTGKDSSNNPTYGTTGNVVFSSSNIYQTQHQGDANINYVLVDNTLDLHVDITKFTVPGVYRYKITDITENDTLVNAGIVRKNPASGFATGKNKVQDKERYLDVYIENATTGGFKVSGYVLTSSNNDATDPDTKTEGFTNTDVYRTYNISITKKTTGALADKTHEFPFTVTINNKDGSTGSTQHTYYVAENEAALSSSTAGSQSITLKNDDTYVIKGLTPFATVAYEETNNTDDTYVVKAEGFPISGNTNDKVTLIDSVSVAKNGIANISAGAVTNYGLRTDKTSEATTTSMRSVVWENNLESVSPTGIVRRFLPYIAMAVVAVILIASIVISRKRSEELDEA